MTALLSTLPPLPVDARGYPVPWFVAWLDANGKPVPRGQGVPDFRVVAKGAVFEAHTLGRCWLCGDVLGTYRSFVIGPMCVVKTRQVS